VPALPHPRRFEAQCLYNQGFALDKIAETIGIGLAAVRSMSVRGKWSKLKAASNLKPAIIQSSNPALTKQSHLVRSKVAQVIEADIDAICSGKGQIAALKRQSQLEPLVRNAKVALGWGEEHTQVLVNISALDSVSPPLLLDSAQSIPLRTGSEPALGEGEASASSDAGIESASPPS